jgi:hypothetical protein
VLHHLVGPTGKVVGIDHIPELVDWSVENLRKDGLGEALEKGQIEMVAGDGRQGTWRSSLTYHGYGQGVLILMQAMRAEVSCHTYDSCHGYISD